jgi:DNA-binding NarL/FixJ family response regulator
LGPAAPGPTLGGDGPTTVRTVIVDDHELLRWGLRALLQRHGIVVVGEAGTAEEAVARFDETRPDVVLMDLRLSGLSGIDATRRILDADPSARVVVLTVSADEQDVVHAVLAGACGYLLKGAPADQLVAAVRAAARGEDPISATVAHALLRRLRARPLDWEAAERIRSCLTLRERAILRRLAEGRGTDEIARDLGISPKTTRNHLSNLFAKLGLTNRVQATLYAIRAGLLEEPPLPGEERQVRVRGGGAIVQEDLSEA